MRTMNFRRPALGAAMLLGLTAGIANGGLPDPENELQIDINAFTTTIGSPPFAIDYTGTLTMSDDDDTGLPSILIDGGSQIISGTFVSFMGQIDFVNGDVTGGWFDVVVEETDMSLSTYSATIQGGIGDVSFQAGQGFNVDGLSFDGVFSQDVFLGVDVLDWTEDQPLNGSFLKFQFEPITVARGEGTIDQDSDTDIDIFVIESPGQEVTDCLEHGDMGDGNNDDYGNREPVNCDCTYVTGKLEKREAPNCEPDTYLFLWDKDDNIVAQDNDSSSLGNGKASAVYGAVPIANGDSPGGTVRIGLTGRPDGIDGHFNGLFFNAAHQQIGEATVYVTYYDGMGVMLGMDSYVADFKTGLDAFRINYEVPFGTETVDVEVDNTTDRQVYMGDVDFYELDCFPAACDVRIKVVGGMDYDCETIPLVLGWYDKNGNLVECFTETTEDGFVFMDVISDANGRVRLAVSGEGDCNFNGILDEHEGVVTSARSVETPCVELPWYHGVSGVYVFCWQVIKHDGTEGGGDEGAGEQLLMLRNGDLNVDGLVDVIDLSIMFNNWGMNTTP